MIQVSPHGLWVLLLAGAAWGQAGAARPEFDVASLKPVVLDGADTYSANLGTYRNGVLQQTNTTLSECLRFAYDITSDDLVSGPEWIKNKMVRFDTLAKTAPTTPRDQALLMLRSLLDDRFKLVLRREPKTMSYWALTAPGGVHKMAPAQEPAAEGGNRHIPGAIHNKHISMLFLATLIARFTRMPVLDQTGITGFFDVQLDWARENTQSAEPVDGLPITEAVQKQLGLKLERRRGPVEVLVVEHAQKTPVAN